MVEELHITLLVTIEKILIQTFHRESILDILKGYAVVLKSIETTNGSIVIVVAFSKDVGKTLGSRVLALDVAHKRQTPDGTTIKDNKRSIKLSPVGIDE